MTKISAKIVADSLNLNGNRLTTFILTFPRYILAEFNTHRMLTKNSASSRAIPFAKMVESVKTNPFIPLSWMKDHKGMQGTDYWENEHDIQNRVDAWLAARNSAVTHAEILNQSLNVTKQLANRLLEPFMWHTIICTGSEWENFFALRASEFADIHMQRLAFEMLEAYNESNPKLIASGDWHIPFGDNINEGLMKIATKEDIDDGTFERLRLKIATARCARISYTVVGEEGKPDDYEADVKLHDRLFESGHFSPFEHAARAMNDREFNFDSSYNANDGEDGTWGWSGNFRGFVQYRKMLGNENRKDDRVLLKV